MIAIMFTAVFAVWCCVSAEAREVLRVGEGGQISWEGIVGTNIAVETIEMSVGIRGVVMATGGIDLDREVFVVLIYARIARRSQLSGS